MPQLAANTPPPADYYAANVRRVLEHVADFHGDLLTADEQDYVARVRGCSIPAQRLYARLLTRKGPWLRQDRLAYAEVHDLPGALAELGGRALIRFNPPAPADALLNLFTQSERQALYPQIPAGPKAAWVRACVTRHADHGVRQRLASCFTWLEIADYALFARCQLLFFGDEHQDLSTFVLQDLGVVRYEHYELCRAERQFSDRCDLDGYLQFRVARYLGTRLAEHPEVADCVSSVLWRPATTRHQQRQRDKALNALGLWHERRGELDQALTCYARAASHPARERRARILTRLGDDIGRDALLDRIRARPIAPEEEDFVRRFARPRARTEIVVSEERLKAPPEIRIEALAAQHLTRNGGMAWHLENRLPLGLAGLAFWDVVFAPVRGAFVNPFQTGPVDLFWPDFSQARESLINAQLERMQTSSDFAEQVLSTWQRKSGVANRLVNWQAFDDSLLRALLSQVPHAHLLSLVTTVIRNLHRLRTGFPDLLVIYGPERYELVEVKGPNDQLQPVQRTWFRTLAELELPARVLKFRL